MKVFKGWYRKSLAHRDAVWHRVYHVGSIFDDPQMANTVCGRRIPAAKCDFNMNPDNPCKQCEKSPVVVIETSRDSVPVETLVKGKLR